MALQLRCVVAGKYKMVPILLLTAYLVINHYVNIQFYHIMGPHPRSLLQGGAALLLLRAKATPHPHLEYIRFEQVRGLVRLKSMVIGY